MKTLEIYIYERSRIFRPSDKEGYKLKMEIVGTLLELEIVRQTIWALEHTSFVQEKRKE